MHFTSCHPIAFHRFAEKSRKTSLTLYTQPVNPQYKNNRILFFPFQYTHLIQTTLTEISPSSIFNPLSLTILPPPPSHPPSPPIPLPNKLKTLLHSPSFHGQPLQPHRFENISRHCRALQGRSTEQRCDIFYTKAVMMKKEKGAEVGWEGAGAGWGGGSGGS